jgi:MYXO-CTERM domain-containing protein
MTRSRTASLSLGLPIIILGSASLPSVAQAWQTKQTGNGDPVRWFDGHITVVVGAPEEPVSGGAASAIAAIHHGFNSWLGVVPGEIEIEFIDEVIEHDGHEGPRNRDLAIARDGQNVVKWIHHDWETVVTDPGNAKALAVAIPHIDSATGEILEVDIAINADRYRFTASPMIAAGCREHYDVQNVIAHEAGHFFGMAHNELDTEATMYDRQKPCENMKRDLADDDVSGFLFLYIETPIPDTDVAVLGCSVGAPAAAPHLVWLLAVAGLALVPRRKRLPSLDTPCPSRFGCSPVPY